MAHTAMPSNSRQKSSKLIQKMPSLSLALFDSFV